MRAATTRLPASTVSWTSDAETPSSSAARLTLKACCAAASKESTETSRVKLIATPHLYTAPGPSGGGRGEGGGGEGGDEGGDGGGGKGGGGRVGATVSEPSTSSSVCPPPEHTSSLDTSNASFTGTIAFITPAVHVPPAHGCRALHEPPVGRMGGGGDDGGGKGGVLEGSGGGAGDSGDASGCEGGTGGAGSGAAGATVSSPSTSSSACPPPEHTSRPDAATDSPALTTASVAPAVHAPPAHGCRTSTASPKEFWRDWVGSDRTLTGETTMATTTTRIHVVESACSARRRFASRSSTDSTAPRGWPWCVHTCAMSCAPETRVSESSHAHCGGGGGACGGDQHAGNGTWMPIPPGP